ncbi:HAD-IIB family hydrolase [Yoonia sediminilitoris]|uniref:Mannosyl-3-phosphoglycerate phosphatase n=1 Tax=Yoonia sediminilitoris TaxID=1286148 RepID=A0A2T6K9M8_9RHOB|nr:HAD hydrolase family protein [Yoonia sediminilitoris]PUB11521.1 mannosyl-3-phosphoglycerate phosphatase [Yoonia sediminilitoris]RCW91721.1 mannosyl-3-phosphoglycerate phosphatase [Yoonia sediminilitoris]
MTAPPPLLVFTDLDGTLIDHDSYRYDAALPALAALRRIRAGIIMASSKTAPEIVTLRDEMGLCDWPAIVENGAGILPPGDADAGGGDAYVRLRAALDDVPPPLRAQYCGFGDMNVAQIAQMTGLPEKSAALAAQRAFSEPGLWTGDSLERGAFERELAQRGIHAREGGRFLTLSFGRTKADQMSDIITRYQPGATVALGDAPNDVEMLQAADYGFIVANPHRDPLPPLDGETAGRIMRTELPGPQGWNRAICDLIKRLKLE